MADKRKISTPRGCVVSSNGQTAQLIQASDTGKLYTLEPDVYIYEVPCRLQYIQEA